MKPSFVEANQVAAYTLKHLGRKVIAIPGLTNRLQYFFLRQMIPLRLARRLVNDAMKKMYGSL